MSNPNAPQYDADALARQLDDRLPSGDGRVSASPGNDPRVRAAGELARGPHPALDDDSVARIEAQLRAAAHLLYAEHPALDEAAVKHGEARVAAHSRLLRTAAVSRGWVRGLARIAAVLAVLIVALYGTVTASADSLPGDVLYPVKRLVERGEIALASDNEALVLRLEFADRRLDEFERLLARGDVQPAVLDSAVDELEAALALVEQGTGSAEMVARDVRALAARHVALAQIGGVSAAGVRFDVVQIVRQATQAAAQSRRDHVDEAAHPQLDALGIPAVPAWQARILPPGLIGNPHVPGHVSGAASDAVEGGENPSANGRGPDGTGPPGLSGDRPNGGAAPPGQGRGEGDPPGQGRGEGGPPNQGRGEGGPPSSSPGQSNGPPGAGKP